MEDNSSMLIKDTGERMVPGFHKGTVLYAEHLTRYLSAQPVVAGKVVLDIASGSGYGTQILAKTAKKVYGVDVDAPSVEYAKKNFSAENIEYKVGDGERIPLKDNSVDVVITFETIEHIPDYKKFMSEVKRVLKVDGLAIISTPNAREFTKGNHFHLHEFEYDELLALVKKEFKNIDPYYQATWVSVMVAPEELILKENEFTIKTHNLMPLLPEKYLYFYLLCSNRNITEKVEPLNALGGHYSARELTDIQTLNDKNIGDYKTVLKNANNEKEMILDQLTRTEDELSDVRKKLSTLENNKLFRAHKKLKSVVKNIVGN